MNNKILAIKTFMNNQILNTKKSISKFETKFEMLRNQMQNIKKPNVKNVENIQKEKVNERL